MKESDGLTLIEIVIALFILGILAAVVITNFLSFEKTTNLNNDSQEIVNVLRLAQSKTLSSESSSQYGVYFDSVNGKYILYKGTSYASRDTSYDQVYYLSNKVEIFSISLGGPNEVVFNKLTGAASQSGSISLRLKSDTTQTKTIYVSAWGVVDVTSQSSPSDLNRVKDSRHVHFDYSRAVNTGTESITLDFDNGAVTQTFSINNYLISGQIDWQGTVSVGGSNQVVKIKTHKLNNPDTQFSVQRDRRFNTKPLKITIFGDSTGNLVNYSADGLTTNYSSVYVSNLVWQ